MTIHKTTTKQVMNTHKKTMTYQIQPTDLHNALEEQL